MSGDRAITLPDPSAEPRTYRDELLAVVESRDPLEVIAETPARIRELLHGRDTPELEQRSVAGEWSAAEILGHLLDDEIVNSFRLRLTLTTDQPSYPGNDPERWVQLPKPPVERVWHAWEGLREYNLWLMRAIPRSAWDHVGLHAEQGAETVEILILKNAGHDLAHLDQLQRCLVEVGSRR